MFLCAYELVRAVICLVRGVLRHFICFITITQTTGDMLSRVGSSSLTMSTEFSNGAPPLLVPMKKEPSDVASVTSERRVTLNSTKKDGVKDDATEDSSSDVSLVYEKEQSVGLGSSKKSRSDTVSSEDSENVMLEWDAAMAQLLYLNATFTFIIKYLFNTPHI